MPLVLAVMLFAVTSASACPGCGCRGGPGYRGPDGKCVGWENIGRVCGSPPTTHCVSEIPSAGAGEAADYGVKALKSKKPK
jgi:hypothetical protein